ncbi:MAG: NAD(P)/FAD-dependent oxidoreductase [Acidobacteriota bacterium]
MRTADTTDVAIIGGGVIGCAIAYYLTRIGFTDVVLFERKSLASGATGICPGGIRQQFEGEADCLLARRSVRFWEQINDILEPEHPFELEQSGYLFLADSEDLLNRFRKNVAMQNRLGIPSQVLSPEEIDTLLPHLNCESVSGGTFCSEDGFLEDCHGVTTSFAQRAGDQGARIIYEEVTKLERFGGAWEVGTNGKSFQSAHVILAAGAESVSLAAGVGVNLPIVTQRRRLAFTAPYSEVIMPPLVIAPERGFAGKQLNHGVFYLGWLREKGEEDELLFVERALQAGATLLPLLADLPVRRVLGGIYDTTPDHRPILGTVPGLDGFYLAAGFSGHGFMIAPAVGEAIAHLVAGQETDLPLERFSLARFSAHTQKEGLVI